LNDFPLDGESPAEVANNFTIHVPIETGGGIARTAGQILSGMDTRDQ
jgi:hypothetical protein